MMTRKKYRTFIKKHEQSIMFLCGFILLGTAFQIHVLGFVVIPVMALLWSLFQGWEETHFVRRVTLTSIVFNGIVWSWLLAITPSGWTTIDGTLAKTMMVATWAGITVTSSVAFLLLAKTWKYLNRRSTFSSSQSVVLFTALWILQEFIRSYLLSVAFAGDGFSLGAHWNYGVLGIALTSVPFSLPLASSFGMYGMSGIVILLAITLQGIVNKRTPKKLIALLLAVHIAAPLYNQIIASPNDTKITVGTLNSATAGIRYDSPAFTNKSSETDLLVLPEYSEVFNEDTLPASYTFDDEFIRQNTTDSSVVVTSVSTKEDSDISRNKVTAYSPEGDVLAQHDKQFLIPGGEFLPFILKLPLDITNSTEILDTYNKTLRVLPAEKPEEPIAADFGKVGALACSGIMSPQLYRDLARQGAQVLANSASLTLVKGSEVFHQKMIGFGKFNAAANQKPFIQSSKLGKSFILDNNGSVLAITDSAVNDYITAEVAPNVTTTLYTRWGEVSLYASFIILLKFIYAILRKQK